MIRVDKAPERWALAAPAGSSTLRVLVVDDEPLLRWSIAQTLVGGGDSVIEAGDGEAALQALANAQAPPDVVLLDYCLPDGADLNVLSAVRRLAPKSQVILMTDDGSPGIVDALRLGVYRVVTKPFDMETIGALVHQASRAVPGTRD